MSEETTTSHGTMTPAMLSTEVLELVGRSRGALRAACIAESTVERYGLAQRAALRAAGAMLVHRAPRGVGARPCSAWERLTRLAPEFTEPAAFFAASARRERALQAGLTTVSAREADDLVREAQTFLDRVLFRLGLPPAPAVARDLAPVSLR